jgi:hypothetical protein
VIQRGSECLQWCGFDGVEWVVRMCVQASASIRPSASVWRYGFAVQTSRWHEHRFRSAGTSSEWPRTPRAPLRVACLFQSQRGIFPHPPWRYGIVASLSSATPPPLRVVGLSGRRGERVIHRQSVRVSPAWRKLFAPVKWAGGVLENEVAQQPMRA